MFTVSTELLGELATSNALLSHALDTSASKCKDMARVHYDGPPFHFALNEAAMTTENLAQGSVAFAAVAHKLEKLKESM